MKPPPLPHQVGVLRTIYDSLQAWRGERSPVVVFDLDATLFDNRARTLEILMEVRDELETEDPGVADALLSLQTDSVSYLLVDTLKNCGIYRADLVRELSDYWRDRFFSDEYIGFDIALEGAAPFVRACYDAGAVVAYVTGRDVPNMLLGTVGKLRDDGFPIAVAGTEVILKPDPNMSDEAFKRGALPGLDRLGDVVAFFDNEPANCNLARGLFPDAAVVMVETQKVPGAPPPVAGVELIADFRMD